MILTDFLVEASASLQSYNNNDNKIVASLGVEVLSLNASHTLRGLDIDRPYQHHPFPELSN